jgi:uroporphyrinogen-III synthase
LPSRPLEGRGIVVTRPAAQAQGLAALIERAGGRALVFPAIEIQDLAGPPLPPLERFDLAIFVSPTAVERAFRLVRDWPPRLRYAAIGRGTARELGRRGLAPVLAPERGADSEALLSAAPMHEVKGQRIAIFRGEGGRELLGETLAARGAQVEYLECYRRALPRADSGPLLAAWAQGAIDAVVVSSTQGLQNLLTLLGDAGRPQLFATPLFVPHERVAAQARALGAREVIVAGPGDDEMSARLVAYFGSR